MPSAGFALAGVFAMLLTGGSVPGLPPNLRVDPALRPVIAHMWETSPTFRTQLARLADEPALLVAVWYDDRAIHGSRRAVTTFVRHVRQLVSAQVRLAHGHDPVELLAHELEHIVEQLDGVNLPMAVSMNSAGVRRAPDGSFETKRAIETGLQVQREVRRAAGTLAAAAPISNGPTTHAQQALPPLRRPR